MPVDLERHLKLCQKYYCVIKIYQPLSGILEKLAMRRQYAGSITFMGNMPKIRAEVLMASARQF